MLLDCRVYWVHLKSHTDICSEGYVGITTRDVSVRFKEHIKSSAKLNYLIHKAIRKHGEEVVITEMLAGSVDYCKEIENSLRPNPYIGWNINIGGCLGRREIKHSEESRKKMSESVKKSYAVNPPQGHPHTSATREHLSKVKKGHSPSEATKQGFLNFIASAPPWKTARGDKEFWSRAEDFYKFWRLTENCSRDKLAKEFGITRSKFQVILENFRNNWIPNLDPDWLEWVESYNKLNMKEVVF